MVCQRNSWSDKKVVGLTLRVTLLVGLIALGGSILKGVSWLGPRIGPAHADLVMSCIGDGDAYIVRITNRGNGVATRIRLFVYRKPLREGAEACQCDVYKIDDIEPGARSAIRVSHNPDLCKNQISVEWTDDSGRQHIEPLTPAAVLVLAAK